MQLRRPLPLLLAVLGLLGGCASTPETLRGEFAELTPEAADSEHTGTAVRWGGKVLSVSPEADRTCLELLALPLNERARPISDAEPGTRFLACRDGFLEPAAFSDHRWVTVTGTLSGFEQRPVGDYDYRYPVVAAESIHRWREARRRNRSELSHSHHGFFGHSRHHRSFHRPFGHHGYFHHF